MISKSFLFEGIRASRGVRLGDTMASVVNSNNRMHNGAMARRGSLEGLDGFESVRNLSHASLLSRCAIERNGSEIESKQCPLTNSPKKYHGASASLLQLVGSLGLERKNRLTETAQLAAEGLKDRARAFADLLKDIKTDGASVKNFADIPGPRGLPFFGSALEYSAVGRFSPKEFQKALRSRHNKYGTIFRERILNEEFVYISDPKDIRLLVQNEGAAPCRPHLEALVESRKQEGLPVGITAMQGKEWLRNRNAINPAISVPKVIKQYRPAQKKIAQDMVSLIRKMRDPKSGEVEGFDQSLNRWALESIAVVLLDTRLGLLTRGSKHTNPAAESLRESMDVFFDYGARLTFGMPTWKIWNTKEWKTFRRSQTEEFKHAGYFVEKKLKELGKKGGCPVNRSTEAKPTACPIKHASPPSSGCPVKHHKSGGNGKGNSHSCLLDHVINNSELNHDDAVTVCLELLAGGIDTTASAAVFTLYHLSVNQQHQEHLRMLLQEEQELSGEIDRERSAFSKYLKACVWESMRLNPLTYANVRNTEKELVFSGYKVPAGTTVRYTSHLMNLENEDYFLDAKDFIPERWLNRTSKYRCKEQFTFTPFGHGARQCPGRRVAEQELDLLFREILGSFKVGYKYGKMGNKVRLFNRADKPAKFDFTPLK